MESIDDMLRRIVNEELDKRQPTACTAQSDYLTMQNAMQVVGVSRKFLYDCVREKRIGLYKIKSRSFVRLTEIERAMLNSRATKQKAK